jgi:UDP-N-acetylmuramyl pentapeptide phosphotransferase/UDP-N-acetylglucosamine-1-phosphate transferase
VQPASIVSPALELACDHVLVFLVSGGVTYITAPLVLLGLRRRSVLDIPNHRSSHSVPTPRGGGLACLAGATCAWGLAEVVSHQSALPLALSVALLAAIGLADDWQGIAAERRLACQVIVGALLGLTVGGGLWVVVGMIVVPASVNVVNFMDGINAITSVTMICWGLTAMLVGRTDRSYPLTVLGGLTSGAALGFLPWNAPVAKLFLGDVGSYLFGGLVAAGIMYAWASAAHVILLLAPLSLYLADTGVVLLKRLARGDSLLVAHREHVYQRLVSDHGMSHISVAILVVGLVSSITVAWSELQTPAALLWTAASLAVYHGLPSIRSKRGTGRR